MRMGRRPDNCQMHKDFAEEDKHRTPVPAVVPLETDLAADNPAAVDILAASVAADNLVAFAVDNQVDSHTRVGSRIRAAFAADNPADSHSLEGNHNQADSHTQAAIAVGSRADSHNQAASVAADNPEALVADSQAASAVEVVPVVAAVVRVAVQAETAAVVQQAYLSLIHI